MTSIANWIRQPRWKGTLDEIELLKTDEEWLLSLDHMQQDELAFQVEKLNQAAKNLPSYLQHRMLDLQGDVRWTLSHLDRARLVHQLFLRACCCCYWATCSTAGFFDRSAN